MTKETLSARINEKTESELEDYADSLSISKSEATDRLLHKAIRIEQGDVEIIPIRSDGGTTLENEVQQTQNQVDEIETVVQEVESELKSDVSNNKFNYAILGTGLIYIMLELGIGLPKLASLVVGVPLIISLLYVNLVR